MTLPMLLKTTALNHCPIGTPLTSHQHFPSDFPHSPFLQKLQACTRCKPVPIVPIVVPAKQFTLQPCPPVVPGAGGCGAAGPLHTGLQLSSSSRGEPLIRCSGERLGNKHCLLQSMARIYTFIFTPRRCENRTLRSFDPATPQKAAGHLPEESPAARLCHQGTEVLTQVHTLPLRQHILKQITPVAAHAVS